MPDFNYTALANTGTKTTGTITAGSEREAAALLDGKGLFPITVALANTTGGGRFALGGGVGGRLLATTYGQLADLLAAGVPLLRSLELLERSSTNKRLQAVLRDVRMNVAEGTGLAQAMAKHPRVFNDLVVSMVRAGQEGGFLEDVLARTATFVEHQEELKGKVIGSLAYPVFLMGAGAAVLLVLIVFFVPKFEPVFAKLKEADAMPTLTVWVLGLSHLLIDYWWAILGVGVAAVFGFTYWSRTDKGRWTLDTVKLRLPLFGGIYKSLALSRFCRILGTMLHNGIPILKALGIAKDSTGNKILTRAVEQSAENITAGQKLADPLRRNKHFPTDVVEMIAIAEESNTLEKVLVKVADSLERRTARNLDLLVKLLEPVMLLVMAVTVLLVVMGLLLPVFKMGSVVGKN
jgi:general secretion pathway protein F/type IV pilus assembly protein PilC